MRILPKCAVQFKCQAAQLLPCWTQSQGSNTVSTAASSGRSTMQNGQRIVHIFLTATPMSPFGLVNGTAMNLASVHVQKYNIQSVEL